MILVHVVWCWFWLLRRVPCPLGVLRFGEVVQSPRSGLCWLSQAWSCAPPGSQCWSSWVCLASWREGVVRRAFLPLSHLAGPYQHFKSCCLGCLEVKGLFLCRWQGFRVRRGGCLDIAGSLQLLHASHVRDRDKALQKGYTC